MKSSSILSFLMIAGVVFSIPSCTKDLQQKKDELAVVIVKPVIVKPTFTSAFGSILYLTQPPFSSDYIYLLKADMNTWNMNTIVRTTLTDISNVYAYFISSLSSPNKRMIILQNTTTGYCAKLALTAVANGQYSKLLATSESGKTIYFSFDTKDSAGSHIVRNEYFGATLPLPVGDFIVVPQTAQPTPTNPQQLSCYMDKGWGKCMACAKARCSDSWLCDFLCDLDIHACLAGRALACLVINKGHEGGGDAGTPIAGYHGIWNGPIATHDSTWIFKPAPATIPTNPGHVTHL